MSSAFALVLGLSLFITAFSVEVPGNVLSAYQEYSRNILTKTDFSSQLSRKDISAVCTFTLGYLLAVSRENTFNIPTIGFSDALRFSDDTLTNAYSTIAASFLEDSNVRSTSTIYTDVANVTVPPGVATLSTSVYETGIHENPETSIETINQRISNATNGAVNNRIIPLVDRNQTENYVPFCKSTRAVYANTFYYRNNFERNFIELGERPFYSSPTVEEKVATLEATGSYPVFECEAYSAVSVPLQGERKRLIFVQPRNSLEEYLQNNISDIFRLQPTTWSPRNITIQTPAIRFLLARNYAHQLKELGITKTFCERTAEGNVSDTVHFLQPPVQVISVAITATDYELTVANAVQVNNLRAYLQDHPTVITKLTEKPAEKRSAEVEIKGGETSFVFNRPFFVYLHDNVLGATSFAAIRSTRPFIVQDDRSPRHHEDPQDFTQATIRHRYEC